MVVDVEGHDGRAIKWHLEHNGKERGVKVAHLSKRVAELKRAVDLGF